MDVIFNEEANSSEGVELGIIPFVDIANHGETESQRNAVIEVAKGVAELPKQLVNEMCEDVVKSAAPPPKRGFYYTLTLAKDVLPAEQVLVDYVLPPSDTVLYSLLRYRF